MSTKRVECHRLSELTERATRELRRAAMEAYLASETHIQMLMGEAFVAECVDSTKKLLEGEISPHLDVCCCPHTFKTILTSKAQIRYKGCDLPDYNGCEDLPISPANFTRLQRLSAQTLRARLVDDYECTETEFVQVHNDDYRRQQTYYAAVYNRFMAAAQYAKAIDSDSARLWLEALCLISPRPAYANSTPRTCKSLNLDADCVERAYEVAKRAQRALWVDDVLRKIKPACLPNARRTAKKER